MSLRPRHELLRERLATNATMAYHGRIEENNVDPDDGNSWLCSACNLPIFSTPFKSYTVDDSSSSKVTFLHDQCADLPRELKDSDLHQSESLILQYNNIPSQQTHCVKCKAICGTMFYYCPDPDCGFQLDVLCALTIKIVHRSHKHRLMVIHSGSASFICGACGTQHQAMSSPLVYLCHTCGFWIHPHCASLPNIIILLHASHQHQHPLLLNYDHHAEFGADSSSRDPDPCYCAICGDMVESSGVYSCNKCRYYVHIMCAVSDPQSFKPVLIREARLPDLVRLPIPDEHTSVIRYITDSTSTGGTSTSSSDHQHYANDEVLQLHAHPLSFHDDHHDINDPRVCNACVQFISPPFYSCSECPNFFLHNCCAHLPRTLTQHPSHKQHPLSLFPKAPAESFISKFNCESCWRPCNTFAYSCKDCCFHMDVLCALVPASITHDAHAKTHILYSSDAIKAQTKWCHCCGFRMGGGWGVCYECGTCRNFALHARCALLPNTVRHIFDQHSLKLITTTSIWSESISTDYDTELRLFCEICESDIDNSRWYYSCDECDQSFHIHCIPCLDRLSKIKFEATVIRVQCHDCPLTLIPEPAVRGYRCGYCGSAFKEYPKSVAFECSKCYFRIHYGCAEKCLLNS